MRLFPAGGSQLEHWWVEKGAGTPSPIGTHTTPIDEAFHHRSISTPMAAKRKSGECIPWQAIHDATNRRGCYTIITTSARVAQAVDAEKDSPAIRVSLEFDENVAPFRSVIRAGGGLALPAVFLGCYEGDVDDGCNRLHRWTERRHLPPSSDPRLPLVVNNTWGRATHIDEASCLAMIEDGAAMGIEVFQMDAGWYRSVGWWNPDPKKFPRGIRLLSDRAREKGMKFGLWVAWTQGGHVRQGDEALCVFEPRMRVWFPDDVPADWRSHPWRGRPCCLDSSAAREWCLKELGRIVREYGVDLLKHDQQMITWDCTRDDHEHTESPLDAGYRAAEGLEKVYSALREQFPDLVIENCVNGACTLDHGIMRQCHYTIATDTYDPLSNRQAFYDASYPLPPRTLEAYVGKHPTPTLDAFRYMLRSGMMGWCTIMIDTTQWSPTQREEARRLIEVYKDTLRPLIRSGNLYHVSPRPRADGWDAIQYMSEDGGEGVVFVFRAKSPDGSYRVRLKGLRPDQIYSIVSEDRKVRLREATGRELMTDGVTVELPRKESSDILHVRQR
ncbi:MAG: alpha-galactosidase [Pirellulaceae bacterium]|nr:alpha-galactosidase [Pirellulaceae bacterium]